MKTPVLALAIATAAFAGSSLYLWSQLREERARAAQVEDATRKLNERVAELEKARTPFSSQVVNGNGVIYGQVTQGSADAAPPPVSPMQPDPQVMAQWAQTANETRKPPEAMEKLMRAQMRTMSRQQYGEFCAEIGLDKETTDKLMNLMADQAMRPFEPISGNPPDFQRQLKERQRIEQAEIAELIGSEKAQALQEYKDSVPARAEADMLAQQLEGNDVPLSEDQAKKLHKIFVEERARVPQPEMEGGNDPMKYMSSVNEWQDDYNRRVAERINHVLTVDQQRIYNEIQEWQDQMRKGWGTSMPMSMPTDVAVSGSGNNFFVVPQSGTVTAVAVSSSAAPAIPAAPANSDSQKKP